MTDSPSTHPTAPAVEFLDVRRIAFAEGPPPVLTPWELSEVDRLWSGTRAGNPAVFDGPLVAVTGIDLSVPGVLLAHWARLSYRYRALRVLRTAADVPGSVFVTVLLPTERGLVVGRGSATTAAPGRWTLPGGAVEPPVGAGPLTEDALRRDAAREVAEEIGVRVAAERLRLFAVTRGHRFGSLGFHFLAPPAAAAPVLRRHAELVAAESGHGAGPELDALAFVSSASAAERLGPGSDYLAQILDRYDGGSV
ncbi:NUDIX domain-containing protein [Streptomyces sp. NPDC057695]|uniref:NUDIX domain-containing protein n=1 Tax=Streptomyces sp. NPDC057695 TaxID=3346217 RepID=UPI0036BDEF85